MKTIQQEYAYYQEGFEIFAFKYKTYGCGKWASTYDEAHELAKEAVLKKCMEENPHPAFTNNGIPKKILKLPDEPAFSGTDYMKHSSDDSTIVTNPNGAYLNVFKKESEKINKGTIEEQIQACTTLGLPDGLFSFEIMAAMNPKLKKIYDKKLTELQKQTV